MNATEAKRIVRDMVCKDCGRSLSFSSSAISRQIRVSCITPGCPCTGYVPRQQRPAAARPAQLPEGAMTPEQARQIVADCVCSDCWEQLVETYDHKTRASIVRCTTEGCACRGYVSRKYVERREGESALEKIEATQALRAAVPWLPKRDSAAILAELGF